MNIFLNAVSKNWFIFCFDDKKNILDKYFFDIFWNESLKLIDIFENFLIKNNIKYDEINNLIVVNWPWSFTWIRIITLFVNTLSYVFDNIKLTDFSYFDLFNSYPIVKQSSKRDLFVKKSKNNIIQILKYNELEKYLKKNKINKCFWETIDLCDIETEFDFSYIIKKIKFKEKKFIQAKYIKKPNIF